MVKSSKNVGNSDDKKGDSGSYIPSLAQNPKTLVGDAAEIVGDDVDPLLARVGCLQLLEQCNGRGGVDPFGLNQGAVEGLQVERAVRADALATRTRVRVVPIATFFEVAQCAGTTIYVCTNPLNISSKYSSARACSSSGVLSWMGWGTNT